MPKKSAWQTVVFIIDGKECRIYTVTPELRPGGPSGTSQELFLPHAE